MQFAFFTNTPAQVHLYRNPTERLLESGHEVRIFGRDYGCTRALLDHYDLPYLLYGSRDTTPLSWILQLPNHYRRIFRAIRRFDPDFISGMGVYAAHAGVFSDTPTVLVVDSEPDWIDHRISHPFAEAVLTPHAFAKDLGDDHYRFRGYKETAYLHPDVFSSAPAIRDRLGVGPAEPYAIVRFNEFEAHHDIGEEGLSPAQRRDLLGALAREVTVFVSDEGGEVDLDTLDARPFDLPPGLLHDALAEARLLVTETQTMATEAALLGTPTVRSNSFVGGDDMGNFLELEREGLIRNRSSFDDVRETALEFATDGAAKRRWRRRRDAHVDGLVNLTAILTEIATNRGTVDGVDGIFRSDGTRAPPGPRLGPDGETT
jgi:predicted glycosyltransferase